MNGKASSVFLLLLVLMSLVHSGHTENGTNAHAEGTIYALLVSLGTHLTTS